MLLNNLRISLLCFDTVESCSTWSYVVGKFGGGGGGGGGGEREVREGGLFVVGGRKLPALAKYRYKWN